MKMIPDSAFGNVVYTCTADQGERAVFGLNGQGFINVGLYYVLEGTMSATVRETSEVIPDRLPGWLSVADRSPASTSGMLDVYFPYGAKWLCIPFAVDGSLPNVSKFELDTDQVVSVPNNSNIYLAQGVVSVNEKVYNSPSKLRIKSGDVEVKCITKCYGLRFL